MFLRLEHMGNTIGVSYRLTTRYRGIIRFKVSGLIGRFLDSGVYFHHQGHHPVVVLSVILIVTDKH